MIHEAVVHFKVIHPEGESLLRGIVLLEKDRKPTLQEIETCLKECGHDAILADRTHLIFQAQHKGEAYLIHVLEDVGRIDDIGVEHAAKEELL